MKKQVLALLLAALTCAGAAQARQIIDRTNNYYINLPDRYLLNDSANSDNRYVVLDAYDPDDDSNFVLKISPQARAEVSGLALDNERSKFRNSLEQMGLEPYMEGIAGIGPRRSHEAIYTFSKVNDQGEILNYLIAKFWAHNKEYSFFCIQSTKTLRTQEFLDTVDSFICMNGHSSYAIPPLEAKKRPEYDKAKIAHDELVRETTAQAESLRKEGKGPEADQLLAALPVFVEKDPEYVPRLEINNGRPLPKNITDKLEHDAFFSEHPEQIYAKAKQKQFVLPNFSSGSKDNNTSKVQNKNNSEPQDGREPVVSNHPVIHVNENYPDEPQPQFGKEVTVIRKGVSSQGYVNEKPQPKLTKEEIKAMEKMEAKQKKFEKEQAKRQEKLDKMRKKELEKQRKQMEKEMRKK